MTPAKKELLRMADEWRAQAMQPYGGKYSRTMPNYKETPAVIEAQRMIKEMQAVVTRWERKRDTLRNRHVKRIDATYHALRQAIYFEPEGKAFATLKRLSRTGK